MLLTRSFAPRLAGPDRGASVTRQDRQHEIIGRIERQGEVSVEALARAFDVSPETIRRDLAQLAEAGAVLKVHGGARRRRFAGEGSFAERMADQAGAKAEIAAKLAGQLSPGETVFVDTGSTTLAAATRLADVPDLTVVTNSVRIAQAMGGGQVLLLGGRYRADNGQTVGPDTVAQIAAFRADAAVLTVTALDAEGAMDADLDEAQIGRAMRGNAKRCIVLAHGAKLGRTAPHRVCRLDQIDVLVCDVTPDAALGAALTRAGVAVC